jgi:DNA-binding IclR family transcriptional regulator
MASADPATAPSIGAVDRAVDVLMLFGRSLQPSLGVTEIADELGMPKSGVHRVLNTLKRRRLITYDPTTRKYALGQAAVSLSQGYAERHDMQSMASQALSELMRVTGRTAVLAIRRHRSVLVRAQAVPDAELRVELRLGAPQPLHVGAAGKAFLAWLPAHEVEDYIAQALDAGGLEHFTAQTIVDPDDLRAELAVAQMRGYTVSVGERLAGVASIAAPVLDHEHSPVSVIMLSGPRDLLDPQDAELIGEVVSSARRMSHAMGYAAD